MNNGLRERRELSRWNRISQEEHDNRAIRMANLINKMPETAVFWDILNRDPYASIFKKSATIIELGCGEGWAGCIVKYMYPKSHYIATDISPQALRKTPIWERIFEVKLDEVKQIKSTELENLDKKADLIFCFAAAHHFSDIKGTLSAAFKILNSGGSMLFLYETSCRKIFYKLTFNNVNKKMENEDVLIYTEVKRIAEASGFKCNLLFYPNTKNRAFFETIYFKILERAPFLQKLFPCTINYWFVKE